MLEAIGEDPKGKRLDVGDRVVPACPIRHNAREVRNLSHPPPILLAVQLDLKVHCLHPI